MVFNTEFIYGGLVNQSELKQSSKGNSFIYFTLAHSYQERKEDGSYNDVHTEYTKCVAFGKTAGNIARANFPLGTHLLVVGRGQGTMNKGWTREDGSVVQPYSEKQVVVDYIGLDLSFGSIQVNYSKLNTPASPQPTQQTQNTFNNTFDQPVQTSQPVQSASTEDLFAGLFD